MAQPGSSTSIVVDLAAAASPSELHTLAIQSLEVKSMPGAGETNIINSTLQFCTPVRGMIEDGSSTNQIIAGDIEASKIHWSHLKATTKDASTGKSNKTNFRIFESLRKQFGDFFSNGNVNGGHLVVGRQIAEGAQADIFEAKWIGGTSGTSCGIMRYDVVLKVFKGENSLRDLQKQWPRGMLRNCRHGPYVSASGNFSSIWGGTLLRNGRFAFWMERFWGDLRKLIDRRMNQPNVGSTSVRPVVRPFLDCEEEGIMRDIAKGMRDLHKDKIIHRDLKASNVLVKVMQCRKGPRTFKCLVADYECSVGVMGTRFWRAPEILSCNVGKVKSMKQNLFTEKSDVYSYAMTCYEVITGKIPFHEIRATDYGAVLEGVRPKLPRHVKPQVRTLLQKCWHENPVERPTFEEILETLPRPKLGFLPRALCMIGVSK